MSPDDKLQAARLIAFGMAIIIASLVWAYSGDLSDLVANKTAQFLGDSFGRMDGIANR